MFYRLSNTMQLAEMEKVFDRSFKFPRVYTPQSLVNGLDEASIPVVLMQEPRTIQLGIWGLLPEAFREDWAIFQNYLNTLNIGMEDLREPGWIRETLLHRRCLILVNGFFVSHLHQGELYPYYVYMRNRKPFAIAGIYNVLDDGFVTSSLLVGRANQLVRKLQNVGRGMPLILPESIREYWLTDLPEAEILNMVSHSYNPDLQAHPIARDLLNMNIRYEGLLDPVFLQGFPVTRS